MEKDKIIGHILNEWAMRSPDGLASGYSSEENVKTFIEVLSENGITADQVDEILETLYGEGAKKKATSADSAYLFAVKDEDGKFTHLVSYGHPDQETYPDGEIYTGEHELPINQYKVANKDNISKARAASEKDPLFRDLREMKKISLDNVARIKEILAQSESKNKKATDLFKDKFNEIQTIQEAIAIYEGTAYPEFQFIINKMDETKFSGAGRGELPFVFLLKGATSGGNREVDILFGEKEIEVKEVQSKKIKISAPTLNGYTNSDFNIAIHELALAVNKIKGFKEFCMKVLEDKGELYMKIDNAKLNDHKESLNKFFADPKVGELTMSLLDAIFIISTKIMNKKKVETKPKATIDIDIQDKHREFKVPEKSVDKLQTQLAQISQGSPPVVLNVPITYTSEKSDEMVEEKAMKLSFFNENWDFDRVQEKIVGELISKQYTKLLVIDKSKGNKADLYGSATIKKLKFSGVGFGKIELTMP